MITVFALALATNTQRALPTAFSIGGQTAITCIFGTNISNAKPTVHSARSDVRHFGECCHNVHS